MLWVYVAAFGAALLFAIGSVIQQRAASLAPPQHTLSLRLLLWLVRQRLWLAGVVASLVGNLLGAAALGAGGVTLVQPLFTVRLLFALPLAAALARVTVPLRDWGGAVATAAGLAVFVVVGQPEKGEPGAVPASTWLMAGAAMVALVAGLTAVARRLDPSREATLLATGAGVLFAVQASLMEVAVSELYDDGVVAMLSIWQPYAVIATALTGSVLIQSAYEMAPLTASYPALVTVEPLVGIAVGVAVLDGSIALGPVPLAVQVVALATMSFGILVLTTSPLVTGQLDMMQRRRDEGLAYRTADQLERDLARLQEAADRVSHRIGGAVSEHEVREVRSLLERAGEELERLDELRADMEHHRRAEREHVQSLPAKERMALAPLEQELEERHVEIDARAERLAAQLRSLEASAAGLRDEG